MARDEFLEPGLVVVDAGILGGPINGGVEEVVDHGESRSLATVEEDGTDHRLHGIGQDGLLVVPARRCLAPAEPERTTEVDAPGDLGQGVGADDARTDLGQLALGETRVHAVEAGGDGEPQDGVAQKLEALVGFASLLGTPGTMRQRLDQQVGVGEPVSEAIGDDLRSRGCGISRGGTRHSRPRHARS